jgi:hypothetical protein
VLGGCYVGKQHRASSPPPSPLSPTVLPSQVAKAQQHLDAAAVERNTQEGEAERAALAAYAARSAATNAESAASELMADVEAALAAEMLAEKAVAAASDMLSSVRAAETVERELQLAELSKLKPPEVRTGWRSFGSTGTHVQAWWWLSHSHLSLVWVPSRAIYPP